MATASRSFAFKLAPIAQVRIVDMVLTTLRERGMRRFKSRGQAQRFLGVRAAVYNLFNLGPHLTAARHFRELRQRAFTSWAHAVAA